MVWMDDLIRCAAVAGLFAQKQLMPQAHLTERSLQPPVLNKFFFFGVRTVLCMHERNSTTVAVPTGSSGPALVNFSQQ